MAGRAPLRQATKLWQEEIDPEFGTPCNDIGGHLMERERLDEALSWLQKAKQVRRCEPRAVLFAEQCSDGHASGYPDWPKVQ